MGLLLNIFVVLFITESKLCFGQVSDAEYARMPTLFHEDNYDECMLDKENSLYCSFSYWLEPINPANPSKIWTTIETVSEIESNYRHDHLRHRICVRQTCPNVNLHSQNLAEQIDECYDKKFESKGLKGNLTNLKCFDAFTKYPIESFDLIFGAFLISYIVFVIYASIYEGIARYKPEKEYKEITQTGVGRFLSAFSLPKNWYRLTEKPKTAEAKKLSSIQGVRFYNMICVIMAHTMMADMSELVSNPKFVETLTHNVQNTIISNGGYVVQTYMLISSWLLTYQFFKMFEGKKQVKFKHVIFTFINRLMRLTPTYAIVLLMQATWLVHFANGPNWDPIMGEEFRNCRRNWWINLLYLNNFIDNKHMCMQHMWYLATDTQLFLFLIILLMFLFNNPSKAKITIAIFTIIGVVLPGIITYIKNFDIILRQYPENMYHVEAIRMDIFAYAYAHPLSNIGGYMIGIICGYLFYHYRNKQFPNGKLATLLWWILSFGLPLSAIFFASLAYNNTIQFTRLHAALYWALGRNIFALGIACALFGMTQGIGWFPRWLCEWDAVTVFGRISYSAYIIHCALIRLRIGITRWPVYQSEGILFYKVLGDITTTYIFAFLLSLFVEMPISALQKFWVPQLTTTETNSIKSKPESNGISNGKANGIPNGKANGVSNGTHNGISNGKAKEIKAE